MRLSAGKRHLSALNVQSKGEVCSITLTRPKALNALNPEITSGIKSQLMEWKNQEGTSPSAFVVKGEGKAFCAGGDVKAIWEELDEGKIPKEDLGTGKPGYLHTDFFRTEYHMNYLLGTSSIPQVSFWDGFVMGGGVGISILGKYRVATEKTVFAMPETAIGLFPDVGSSYWLPHVPGGAGYYLGLTGSRVFAKDLLSTGMATHYVSSDKLEDLEEAIAQMGGSGDLEAILDRFQAESLPHVDEKFAAKSTLSREVHGAFIEKCFHPDNASTVEAITANLKAMENEGGAGASWASDTLATMAKMSPTSMAITHQQLQEGACMLQDKGLSDASRLAACLKMEYRLAQRCMAHGDFSEGIRAVLVDKDHTPRWAPLPGSVDAWFEPLGHELGLEEALGGE